MKSKEMLTTMIRHGSSTVFTTVFITIVLAGCDSGLTAEQHFAQAMEFSDQGDFQGMTIELKNALLKDESFFEGRRALGEAYILCRQGTSAGKPPPQQRHGCGNQLGPGKIAAKSVRSHPGPDQKARHPGGRYHCANISRESRDRPDEAGTCQSQTIGSSQTVSREHRGIPGACNDRLATTGLR